MKTTVLVLLPAIALAFASCSSPPPPPPPPVQAATASSSAAPELIDVRMIMETSSGLVTVNYIDPARRVVDLKRADGDIATYKVGPEVRRFNELKVGDQIMTTVTDNYTIFVVKGPMTPSAAATQAVVRTPEGSNLGGTIVRAVNVVARVLDVDWGARQVLLQYGPTQTRSVQVRPTVDLTKVGVNDTVLVRGTQSISILVANP